MPLAHFIAVCRRSKWSSCDWRTTVPASRKATVQNAEAPWEIDPKLQLTALTCAATLVPVRHGTLARGYATGGE